jgi:glycolate oxidase
MSKMAEILRVISDIAKRYDLKIPAVGHVGDSNLHLVISFDGTNPEEVKQVEETTEELLEKVIKPGVR